MSQAITDRVQLGFKASARCLRVESSPALYFVIFEENEFSASSAALGDVKVCDVLNIVTVVSWGRELLIDGDRSGREQRAVRGALRRRAASGSGKPRSTPAAFPFEQLLSLKRACHQTNARKRISSAQEGWHLGSAAFVQTNSW